MNRLTSGTDTNPEALLIDKENVADIEAAIEKELSSFEKQVLDLYLTGMTYSQIAKVLGRDEKSADNALQRLKGKIRRAMHKSHMMIAVGLVCLLWPLQAFAEQEMTRVSVEAAPMEISLPDDCYILQQEIAEDDPYLQKAGGDRDKIEAYYKEAGIVLNAIAQDDSYEIVVTVNENQDVTYLYNMHSVPDESVRELAQTIQNTYEEHGYTVDDFSLYENETAKYIVFSFGQQYEEKAVQCVQYDTIRDSRMYNITLRSYTGEVSDAMEEMLREVIDSIVYTQNEEALTYENEQWGVSYELNPGWKEITSDQDADIQAQYMHTNGLGESVQFIARDIWGEMDMLHQLTNTRGELDGDRELTPEELHKLYPYLGDFFAGEDTVTQKKIQDNWYFVSDTPLEYSSDKLQGVYQQKTVAALRQGILYVWQYGAYEDGNLHETDYDYMIQGITYQQPELLQKDAQIYQNMVRKIPLLIFGGVVILGVLIAAMFLYIRGGKETII